ncbi:MAG: hypothetical protein GF353_17185 [Candidatus Lokiarchaeota archaeon]|nr:hypothetical protein [Candidatus Lokiarchaeota archaeon]
MEKSFKIQYEFLKWFLIFVILEAAIFVNLINGELFVFKLLLNNDTIVERAFLTELVRGNGIR